MITNNLKRIFYPYNINNLEGVESGKRGFKLNNPCIVFTLILIKLNTSTF